MMYMDGIDGDGNLMILINLKYFKSKYWWKTNSHKFNGSLDDIAIYNRTLTLEEIIALSENADTDGDGILDSEDN